MDCIMGSWRCLGEAVCPQIILGKDPKHDVELDLELGLALRLDLELRLAPELKTSIFLRYFKLCHQKCQFRVGFGGVTSTLTR